MPEQVDSKAKKFTIQIKFAASIDMSCLEQVLKGKFQCQVSLLF